MQNQKNGVKYTIITLLAIVAIITGVYSFKVSNIQNKKVNSKDFNGTLLDTPRQISEFNLQRTDKKIFNNKSLLGHWTFIFFGFTNCGYMCPTTMAELGKTYRLLQNKGTQTLPEVVMISLDPKRDSLEKLEKYVHAFDAHFYGARGSDADIHAMTQELGIAYANVSIKTSQGKEKNDIEHTGAIMLFNPKGKLAAFFTSPHNSDLLAKDFLILTN